MEALLIDKFIYCLFVFEFIAIPILIVSIPVCVILDIKIKHAGRNKNYLGKGKKEDGRSNKSTLGK